jgi:hypothetical protein
MKSNTKNWESRLSPICRFVEVDCACQVNSENILLVDAFSLGWHVTNIYPSDSSFEPNATRRLQYAVSPTPPNASCLRLYILLTWEGLLSSFQWPQK